MGRWAMWLGLLAGALGLVGCGATGPRYSEVAKDFPPLGDDQGRIIFYRASGIGPAVQPDVRLNGQVVGTSQPHSFFFVDRPVGTYRAVAQTEVETSIALRVQARSETYVQMGITLGFVVGHPTFTLVTREQAQGEIGSLAYGGTMPLASRSQGAAAADPSLAARPATAAGAPAASSAAQKATPARSSVNPPSSEAAAPPAPAVPAGTAASTSLAKPFARTSAQDLRQLLSPATP